MFDIGRVCMKIAGREAGRYCTVVKKVDTHFVEVTGPEAATGVRRRKCNINHLEPLSDMIELKDGASDEQVLKAWSSAKLFAKFKLTEPTAEKMKAYEAMRTEKEKHKAATAAKEKEKKEKEQSAKKEEKPKDKTGEMKIGDIMKQAEKKDKAEGKKETAKKEEAKKPAAEKKATK